MTLIVSLRIPDGIVLAGDSLSTLMSGTEVQGDINVVCPQCGHQHTTSARLQGATLPATTFSYAQKVFPFLDKYGVGTSGAGQLTGKTIYFAMRELEQEILKKPENEHPQRVSEAAALIGQRAHELLREQLRHMALDLDNQPDNWEPLTFQVVGYEGNEATTTMVKVGKQLGIQPLTGPGCTVTGRPEVVNALWGLTPNPEDMPVYPLFSLQDAITYAEFLINATALHQRFLRTIPTVGGEIDVALITPFDNFRWIRQKALFAQLVGGSHGNGQK